MLIACIVLVCLLAVFILVTYIMTIKNYAFDLDEGKLRIHNQGSKLKIFVDEKVVVNQTMPQLINGEEYLLRIKETEYRVICKCNGYGNKFRVEIYKGENLIKDNGVVINSSKQKKVAKK